MAIKELAGHRQISTTVGYMHLSPSAKDAAIRLLIGEGRETEQKTAAENQKAEQFQPSR